MEFTNPTKAATGAATSFKLNVQLTRRVNGESKIFAKGSVISIPLGQAQKWQAQKLGTIMGDVKPVAVKG